MRTFFAWHPGTSSRQTLNITGNIITAKLRAHGHLNLEIQRSTTTTVQTSDVDVAQPHCLD